MRATLLQWKRSKSINMCAYALTLYCTLSIGPSTLNALDDTTDNTQVLRSVEKAFTQLADKTRRGVVAIVTYQSEPSADGNQSSDILNQGSGFIIDTNGLIVTNHHVVANAGAITVILSDGTRHIATIVASDYRSDLSVLSIPQQNLEAAVLSDLSHLTVGQWAFVVGNPYGLAVNDGHALFTAGVVSGIGQSLAGLFEEDDDRYLGNMIETDIYLKPGYSGGPMFNIDGEIIGIATAVLTKEGQAPTGFAIPMTQQTKGILTTLSQGISIQYGTMGAHSRTVAEKEAKALGLTQLGGAMITKVAGGGSKNPSARAGLRRRDIITQFGDHKINNADQLLDVAAATPVGEEIEITFYRKGEAQKTSIKLVDRREMNNDRPRDSGPRVAVHMLTWHGCLLIEATEYYRDLHNLPREVQGLYISQIQPNTLAAMSSLRTQVFITKYNGNNITTINSFLDVDDQVKHGIARIELSNGEVVNVNTAMHENVLATH